MGYIFYFSNWMIISWKHFLCFSKQYFSVISNWSLLGEPSSWTICCNLKFWPLFSDFTSFLLNFNLKLFFCLFLNVKVNIPDFCLMWKSCGILHFENSQKLNIKQSLHSTQEKASSCICLKCIFVLIYRKFLIDFTVCNAWCFKIITFLYFLKDKLHIILCSFLTGNILWDFTGKSQ